MAIDSRIALGLQPLNISDRLGKNIQNLQQIDLLNQRREQAPFQNQLLQLQTELQQAQQPALMQQAERAGSGEQQLIGQQQQMQQIATGYATALQPLLNNPEALVSELQRQKQLFSQQGIDTRGIDEDIAQAQTPQGLQALAQEVTQILRPQGQQQKSVSQREYEAALSAVNADPQLTTTEGKAAAIKLGLAPRATGSAAITTAQDPSLTSMVATSQSEIEGAKEEAKQTAQNVGKAVGKGLDQGVKAFEKIPQVKTAIQNYDEAIAALDSGASTGTIASLLPSFTEAGKNLDNTIKRLGLDVVGNTTFGALSESELAFALKAAIPDNLPPAELRKWLVAKKGAQQKILTGLDEMANFLGGGTKTLVDWNNQQAINKLQGEDRTNEFTGFKVVR